MMARPRFASRVLPNSRESSCHGLVTTAAAGFGDLIIGQDEDPPVRTSGSVHGTAQQACSFTDSNDQTMLLAQRDL
jgi:hypothetical protein